MTADRLLSAETAMNVLAGLALAGALAVASVAYLAGNWPPRATMPADASGMLDQGSRSSPQSTTSVRGLVLS